jgi:uncharacterized membrane protein
MYYVFILTLIIAGAVAASSFLQNKIPQTKVAMDFLNPHSSWIGLVSFVLSLFWFFKVLINIGTMLKWAPVNTIIYLVSVLILMVLGFLLAQSLFKQFAGKNAKVDEIIKAGVDKFGPLTEKLGLAAIIAGFVNLLIYIT